MLLIFSERGIVVEARKKHVWRRGLPRLALSVNRARAHTRGQAA
jgi:hypothetical protein